MGFLKVYRECEYLSLFFWFFETQMPDALRWHPREHEYQTMTTNINYEGVRGVRGVNN